jgi:hypothetical protein
MKSFTYRKRADSQTVKSGIRPLQFYVAELPAMPKPRVDSGWTDGGLCPFHCDRHRGSFRINLTSGAFKCFSCDASGGDVIAFVQRQRALPFGAAVKALADEWGV